MANGTRTIRRYSVVFCPGMVGVERVSLKFERMVRNIARRVKLYRATVKGAYMVKLVEV